MPRRSAISKLPPTVRDELHQRLVATAFGDVVETAAWLSAKGHQVGKTAIAAYGRANREAIVLDVWQMERIKSPVSRQLADIRLRCLEAAANNGPAKTTLARAAAYTAWVLDA